MPSEGHLSGVHIQSIDGESDNSSLDVLGLVWRARRAILLSVLLCGSVYAAVAVCVLAFQPKWSIAEQEISFTFDGAKKGNYPNGMPFSPQDLTAAPVLKMVFDDLRLGEFMQPTDLSAALGVTEGGGLTLALVQLEYTQRLQNTKLTEPERAQIVSEYRDRARQLAGKQFVLRGDFQKTALPPLVAERIVARVPEAWAIYAKQTRGVAQYELSLPKVVVFSVDDNLFDQWATLEAEFFATENLAANITKLPGAAQLRDERGSGIGDIQRRMATLRRTRLEPLEERVLNADPAAAVDRLQNNVEAEEARFELAKRELDAAQEIFVRYVTIGRSEPFGAASTTGASGSGDARTTLAATGVMPAAINLPENLITKLFEMRSIEADLTYRQKLNDNLIACTEKMLQTSHALSQDKARLAKAESMAHEPASDIRVTTKAVADLKSQLAEISTQCQAFVDILTERNLNPGSVLYRLEGPASLTVMRSVEPRQLALGGVATLIIACVVGILLTLRPARPDPEIAGRIQDAAKMKDVPVGRVIAR